MDPTSPPYIRAGIDGATLYVPSCYLSWKGEALDEKIPLLRSVEAVSREAVKVLHLAGNKTVTSVWTGVGSEQEFFLVDRALFQLRPDLVASGRTLLGARPSKGQEMVDSA